jgi:lipopolysaccharide export system protein LptA
MVIRADKLVVSQDADGYQTSVASGGPGGLVRFRQKREGKDELVEGEAERLEHNGRTERAEFFSQAHVKSGQDEIRGQYIAYDGRTEQFVVTGAAKGVTAAVADRVRAVIQPKRKDEGRAGGAPKADLPLRGASEITSPRKE